MRKGFVYYKDPRDNTFVTPRQGQFYLALDQSGRIEVRGDQGQSIVQTQFIGTGSTTPGQYLPLAGGTVTGPVLFKGNVDFTNPVTFQSSVNFTDILSSGGTDLSIIISDAVAGAGGGIQGGPFLPVSGGTGGPYVFTGNTNFTGLLQSGGTDISTYFADYLKLAGGTVSGNLNVTAQIQSGGTDLSVLFAGGGGGAVSTYTNGVDNRVITSTAADGINGEANLTFNGSTLAVTGSITATVDVTATSQLKGATLLSGFTDVSTLFRAKDYVGGMTSVLENFDTLNDATENPYRVSTSRLTTTVAGALYYLSSNGAWAQADASSSGSCIGYLGVAETTSSKNPGMLVNGIVLINDGNFGGTAVTGATVYVSETTGQFTFDPPNNSGAVVRAVGHFIEEYNSGRNVYYNIHFNPSSDYFVVT
ncbi:MAG: hypothetical protein P8J32_05115 [bacterium]|nr:hypothetical protein [bacterium]